MARVVRLVAVCAVATSWLVPVSAHALFSFIGVAQNVPVSSLEGWTQCYSDTYGNSGTPVSTILSQCSGAQLLLACRPVGSSTLTLAANAPRADVIFDTGTGVNSTHTANGVNWYFNDSWSWGFAPSGDSVFRDSCDTTNSPDGNLRMCWHTNSGDINPGYRCGNTFPNGTDWERLIFQSAAPTSAPALSWHGLVALGAALLAVGAYATNRHRRRV